MNPAFIPALQGLRGLAAVMALWARLGFVPCGGLRPLLATDMADDVFFCLSGFLLCQGYNAGGATRLPPRYWRRRAWRLAPSGLLLLAGLAPPVWPVPLLLFCYVAIFPLFFMVARLAPVRRAALPACGVLAFAATLFWLKSGWLTVFPGSVWDKSMAGPLLFVLLHGAAMFLAGAFAGLLRQRDDPISRLAGDATISAALATGFTLAGSLLALNPGEFAGLAVPALVLGLAAAPGGAPAGLLAARPWQVLGRLAYPLYLLFGPVQAALAWAAPALRRHPEAKAAATALAVLLLSAAVSALLPRRMRAGAL